MLGQLPPDLPVHIDGLPVVALYHNRVWRIGTGWQESVELVRQAKKRGLPVTCEVTPHHLLLCETDIKSEF